MAEAEGRSLLAANYVWNTVTIQAASKLGPYTRGKKAAIGVAALPDLQALFFDASATLLP